MTEKDINFVEVEQGGFIISDNCRERDQSCQYKYIKLKGKLYKRIADSPDDFDFEEFPYCSCGVKTGLVHHMGCDQESCPKCGIQLLACDCDWVFAKDKRLTEIRKLI